MIFQHNGDTYIMAGHGCFFCPLGNNGFLWKADDCALQWAMLSSETLGLFDESDESLNDLRAQ